MKRVKWLRIFTFDNVFGVLLLLFLTSWVYFVVVHQDVIRWFEEVSK